MKGKGDRKGEKERVGGNSAMVVGGIDAPDTVGLDNVLPGRVTSAVIL